MEIKALENKLIEFKQKQSQIDQAWRNTGNRRLIEFFVEIIPKALSVDRCSIFVLDPKDDQL